jgi:hypothetical protein
MKTNLQQPYFHPYRNTIIRILKALNIIRGNFYGPSISKSFQRAGHYFIKKFLYHVMLLRLTKKTSEYDLSLLAKQLQAHLRSNAEDIYHQRRSLDQKISSLAKPLEATNGSSQIISLSSEKTLVLSDQNYCDYQFLEECKAPLKITTSQVLSRLRRIQGDLTVTVTSVSIPLLEEITGDCILAGNFHAPLLKGIKGSLRIFGKADLPQLEWIGGDLLAGESTNIFCSPPKCKPISPPATLSYWPSLQRIQGNCVVFLDILAPELAIIDGKSFSKVRPHDR